MNRYLPRYHCPKPTLMASVRPRDIAPDESWSSSREDLNTAEQQLFAETELFRHARSTSDFSFAIQPDLYSAAFPETPVAVVEVPDQHASPAIENPARRNRGLLYRVRYLFDRCLGLVDVPLVLTFGVVLYLVDVGSDIVAAVNHFDEGHPVWGSLTVAFVVLPAICWAAVSWTWWHDDADSSSNEHKAYRRRRMALSVLLLDPLTRSQSLVEQYMMV